MKEIPVMFCFDKNYVIPASVAFLSLLEHSNKNYKYIFYVLHTDISIEQQNKLEKTLVKYKNNHELHFLNMENKFEELWIKVKSKVHFTKEVLYKLLVASIFPQHDKIIVSDVDVVFLDDISESFFSIDVSKDDCYFAGVKQVGFLEKFNSVYETNFSEDEIKLLNNFCGGYLVFNLKKMREDNFEKTLISYLNDNAEKIVFAEQDVLNICVKEKGKYLPLNYVTCTYLWDFYKTKEDLENDSNYKKDEFEDAMQNPIQLHYASTEKPWKNVDTIKSGEWFKYIVKTEFLEDFLRELPYKIVLKNEKITDKNSLNYNVQKLFGKKINIIWLVNELFINNFKYVYEECKKLSFINLTVLAVPHLGSKDFDVIKSKDVSEFLKSQKIDNIDSYNYDNKEFISLEKFNPDYVFYMTPYNFYVPEIYSSSNVKKYAKVCHVSYGSCLIEYENEYENMNDNPFYKDCYNFFCEATETIQKRYIEKFKVIGCLKIDDYLFYEKKNLLNKSFEEYFTIIWKPRWTLEPYDSHFFEYIDKFIEKVKEYPNIKFKICFHPLFEYKVKRKNLLKKYRKYNKILNKYSNYQRIEGSNYLDDVLSANILISDISSSMAEYAFTGEPIIYTSSGIKLNDMGEKIVKNCYVVYDENELGKTIDQLINKKDSLKKQRQLEKNNIFFIPSKNLSSSQYLIKYLINDYIASSKINSKTKKKILGINNQLFIVKKDKILIKYLNIVKRKIGQFIRKEK